MIPYVRQEVAAATAQIEHIGTLRAAARRIFVVVVGGGGDRFIKP